MLWVARYLLACINVFLVCTLSLLATSLTFWPSFTVPNFHSRGHSQGRENTPEEEEWLNSPDLPAWARSQLVKKG
jgi:hypothetical protein